MCGNVKQSYNKIISTSGRGRSNEKPNVIFLLSDDHGAWAMGCAMERMKRQAMTGKYISK